MRLLHRITLAILSTLLLVVALFVVSTYVSVERGFSRYVSQLERSRVQRAATRLTAIYARDRDWSRVTGSPHILGAALHPSDGPMVEHPQHSGPPPFGRPPMGPEGMRPPPGGPRGDGDPLALPHRTTLYNSQQLPILGTGTFQTDQHKVPMLLDGQIVGWLGMRSTGELTDELDLQYLRDVRAQLLIVGVSAIVLGLLTGWLIAKRLLQPIEALSSGARRLAAGEYDTRIAITEADELGQLARDFDSLAQILGDEAKSRKQWVADTSHELRTPIAILRAEIEAMEDGVRPVTPEALASLRVEVLRLSKLVEDLQSLARSDRGALSVTRVSVATGPLVNECVQSFQTRFAQKNISISSNITQPQETALVDPLRMKQVLTNLLENSLRYTDAGGKVLLSSAVKNGRWVLSIEDSAPGVPDDSLPRLFERFYRVDASRSREFGGSGLGLSICQRLVEAQDGEIRALHSELGGLKIELVLKSATQ